MKKSITTKKGDSGKTGLLDNTQVSKYDIRPETYGTLDEAAAFIGLARAKSSLDEIRKALRTVLIHIYLINAELACPAEFLDKLKKKITPAELSKLEEQASLIEAKLDLPAKFVIYGQSETSACLDIARAVVRRAERRLVELNQQHPLQNPTISAYINRLSDALYLFARYEEFANNIPFAHPDTNRTEV